MKAPSLLIPLLFILLTLPCHADQRIESQIFYQLQKGDTTLLNEVASRKDETALEVLARFMSNPKLAKKNNRAELFAAIPEAEQWVRKKLASLPITYETEAQRYDLIMLSHVRQRWVVNFLGEILEKQEPTQDNYTMEQHRQFALSENPAPYATRNDSFAAEAFAYMRLANPPTKEWPNGGKARVALWREWWIKNKDKPDSFFFDGAEDLSKEPVWDPPAGYIPLVIPDYIKQEQDRRDREANNKNKPPASKAPQEIQAVLPTPEKPNWLPFILLGIFLAVALALVFLKKRRQG